MCLGWGLRPILWLLQYDGELPISWGFAAVWQAAASGPDSRRLVAVKGEQVLSAFTAEDLAAKVTAESIAEALREE